jgi:hypothetical protein
VSRRAAVLLTAFLLVAFTACGDDAPDMSPSAASRLQSEVAAVRDAVDSGDDATAVAQLASLRTTVVELVGTNGITPDRAIEINAAIARLEGELTARAAPSSTAPPQAPTTTVSAVPVATTVSSTTTSTTATTTPDGKDKPGKDKDEKKPKDD